MLQFSHGYHNKAFSYSFNCYSNLCLLKRLNGLFLYVTVGTIAFFSLLREHAITYIFIAGLLNFIILSSFSKALKGILTFASLYPWLLWRICLYSYPLGSTRYLKIKSYKYLKLPVPYLSVNLRVSRTIGRKSLSSLNSRLETSLLYSSSNSVRLNFKINKNS